MARRFNPYPTGRTEPNMRQEMINTLQGSYPEISKKQIAVYRKMRTPLVDNICPCVSNLTQEADKDNFCPICFGEGYKWDETFIDVYKIIKSSDIGNALIDKLETPGLIAPTVVVFYTEYEHQFIKQDSIVELVLDAEGIPVKPYARKVLYRVGLAIDFRSDDGKLEYWKLACTADNRKFLNGIE